MSADHDWTLTEDADDPLSTGHEAFLSPTGDIRVSAWSIPPPSAQETWSAVEAWVIEQYCPNTGEPSCTGVHERAVQLCIERWDCHPGLLVPYENDVQAFLRGGIIGANMVVVAVWRPESDPTVEPYGGARALLEAFLSTMGVCPWVNQSPAGPSCTDPNWLTGAG